VPFKLFGRRIRVRVGSLVICDLDPRVPESVNSQRNLDVQFSTQSHVKAEPLVTELTIYGLDTLTRKQLTANNDLARRTAWQNYQAVQVGEVLVEPPPEPPTPPPSLVVFDVFEDFVASQTPAAPAPLPTTEQLVSQGATVVVEAGYDNDIGPLARAQILPDGLEHARQPGGGWITTIKAQDSRLPWANAFVSEEIAPGVALEDMNQALRISEQYLAGEIGAAEVNAQIPGLIERLDGAGYENGRVLHGATRDENAALMQTLGVRGPFLINGTPVFVSANTTIFGVAIVLQLPGDDIDGQVIAPGGLLTYKELPRGFLETTSLLNHRLVAGRQVKVLDELGMPIGGGLYRVDFVQHAGSSFEQSFYSNCILRPVTVAPENNP
jgi:hypothetical protein